MDRARSRALVVLVAILIAACTGVPGDEPTGGSRPPRVPVVTEPVGDWFESSCALPLDQLRRQRAGTWPGRSPELSVVPREPNYFGGFTAYTHSGPWDYVQEVPLVFYGPGIVRSRGRLELDRRVTLADVAPTLARMVGIELPGDRPGSPLPGILEPDARRPRLVVQVVWDGGGWNVLRTWPRAWPTLRRLMREGAGVEGVEVGSSPSVTPAVHATIGTGAFPKQHGIVDIPLRHGDRIVGAFDGRTPRYLELTTVADVYDQAVGNAAEIGLFSYKSWHLGLMGHGAWLPGADRDIHILADKGSQLTTNERWYELPPYVHDIPGFDDYVRRVDIEDGRADGKWMGHDVLHDPTDVRDSPVWAMYQTDIMLTVLEREGFGRDDITDMFFINYKQVDDVGHDYNMLEPEVREIISYADSELARLLEWLEDNVGRGNYVLMVTADHGQGPEPLRSGAWPIRMQPLIADIGRHFGVDGDALFDEERPGAFWVNRELMRRERITLEELADFFINYRLEDNADGIDEEIMAHYRHRLREPVFAAAYPTRELGQVWACAQSRR